MRHALSSQVLKCLMDLCTNQIYVLGFDIFSHNQLRDIRGGDTEAGQRCLEYCNGRLKRELLVRVIWYAKLCNLATETNYSNAHAYGDQSISIVSRHPVIGSGGCDYLGLPLSFAESKEYILFTYFLGYITTALRGQLLRYFQCSTTELETT